MFQKTADTFEAGALTLPGCHYASENRFRTELERIFYERWICAGREAQVPNSGDYSVVQIGAESVIVVRDGAGGLRAFYNVCRHRGARICTEAGGSVASFRCHYHGWTYDLLGNLVGAPLMQELPDFRKSDFSLHPVAVHLWEGFVFLNLSRQPQSFASVFEPVAGRFAQWQLPQLAVARTVEYDIQANWKLLMENYSECYHCPLVHPDFSRKCQWRSGRNDLFEGPFLGGFMELNEGAGSLTRSGRRCGPVLGDVSGDDLRRAYFYALFPNMTLSLHPDYVMYFSLWPVACDRTRLVCEWLFPSEALARGDCDPDDAVAFWDTVNREDWMVCERVQDGAGSRAYQPSPYSNAESLLVAFNREVLKAIGDAP